MLVIFYKNVTTVDKNTHKQPSLMARHVFTYWGCSCMCMRVNFYPHKHICSLYVCVCVNNNIWCNCKGVQLCGKLLNTLIDFRLRRRYRVFFFFRGWMVRQTSSIPIILKANCNYCRASNWLSQTILWLVNYLGEWKCS